MADASPIDILIATGAVVEGHFLLPDGTHAERRLRVGKATQFAPYNRKLCYQIVRHFLELDIHVIVAASVGSIPAAVEIGRQLEARTVFVDLGADGAALHEGFELHEGERAVVVVDILLEDRQLDAHAALIRRADARLIGIGSIVDARTAKTRMMVRDVCAARLPYASVPAERCPLCASGTPLSPL